MRCRVALILAVGVALGIAGTAWAFPPSNPYNADQANIQSMIDRTSDFSGGNQASSETRSNVPGGIKVNVDWYTGASGFNEAFTRIVLTHQYPNGVSGNPDLRGDLSNFDGVKWCITSTTDLTVKPYTQTGTNFSFFEGSQAGPGGSGTISVPGDGLMHMVSIDWNMVSGSGMIPLGPGPGTRQDIFEHGFQIFGPSPPQDTGQHITGMVTITQWVPEPGSVVLAAIGGLGLVGMVGRKLRK